MKLMLDKIIISTIQQRTHGHQNWYATLMPFSSSLFLIVFHDILMINFNFFDSLGCQFLVIWDNYQNETEKIRSLAFQLHDKAQIFLKSSLCSKLWLICPHKLGIWAKEQKFTVSEWSRSLRKTFCWAKRQQGCCRWSCD